MELKQLTHGKTRKVETKMIMEMKTIKGAIYNSVILNCSIKNILEII